jgi:hypothetical protein
LVETNPIEFAIAFEAAGQRSEAYQLSNCT